MRNMNYFCIVKRFKTFIILTIICLISLNTNEISASNSVQSLITDEDSIEISLLTCAPGQEVYSLYGHTAIRYNDNKKGIDIAINYGMFSFKAPFFILRFIFGLTDYEMGIIPFDAFCEEYRYENRSVTQQVLNLTAKRKKEIIKAIEKIIYLRTEYTDITTFMIIVPHAPVTSCLTTLTGRYVILTKRSHIRHSEI